ncbi:GNAT family N-acetyltransferase [Marinomonas sp. 15G1-11]|uniref:GNAT family N-acetyltransferase n=1 Tax=Marinomonas phaeophyticola TaxID=3004091 RepID=A0ABT4JSR0_9GAMM|nr:GNAT family N-acetyltransferase [Marinomonas sp. 15G1-11]MCZ2721404.1 GNAT family N-acetyltransferase [Marinomonas sp. 15G1-11]
MLNIALDDLESGAVLRLLEAHLKDMYATSPAESVHALDPESLKQPSISFWSATQDNEVLGCIALKELTPSHAEIKSMRTCESARNQGVASQLLQHVLTVASSRKYNKLSLETGSMDFFLPARTLYKKYGFDYCGPFADYSLDPNSVFMERIL